MANYKRRLKGPQPIHVAEKWSNGLAIKILDWLCEHPSIPKCAEKFDLSAKLIWIWARNSSRDRANNVENSKYVVHGWDNEPGEAWPPSQIYFDLALRDTRRIHSLNLESSFREEMSHGRERKIIQDGKIQYQISEASLQRLALCSRLEGPPHSAHRLRSAASGDTSAWHARVAAGNPQRR
jgi:hypothetical protein